MSTGIRILATADWQLGKLFSGVAKAAQSFREQLFKTAEQIINEMSVDFDIILILGDMFDRPDADWELISRVAELLRKCSKPIHIIPGNHDYWHSGGVLSALNNELEGSEHIVIHSEQKPYPVKSLNLTIYPGVLRQRNDFSDRVSWIPGRKAEDGIRIGMFHESIPPFGDFDHEVAINHDLDIALLGDWHGPSGENDASLIDQPDRKLWYAGSHEAQNISQHWQGRVLSITAKAGCELIVEPIVVGKLKFIDEGFEFHEDMENPLGQLVEKIGTFEGDKDLTFIRFTLTGEAEGSTLAKLEEVLDDIRESWPNIVIKKSELAVLINPSDETSMRNLHAVEAELQNMKLDKAVLARAVIFLHRYFRRLL